jgi:hypothetical protein
MIVVFGEFSANCFGVDDILNTTELIDSQGILTTTESVFFRLPDYGFNFSYGRKLPLPDFTMAWMQKSSDVLLEILPTLGFGFDAESTSKKKQLVSLD